MKTQKNQLLLWIDDVKELLGRSVSTINRLIESGEMPAPDVKIRGQRAWKTETITAWIEKGCPALNPDDF